MSDKKVQALILVEKVLVEHNMLMVKKKMKKLFYIDMVSINGITVKSPYEWVDISKPATVRIGRNIIIIGEVASVEKR